MGAVDVKHQILGNADMQCPFCRFTGKLREFGRWVTDRAGLTVVNCHCRLCERDWRRIII